MNIGILAVDSNSPNLALMKISAYQQTNVYQMNGIIHYVNMISICS